MPRDLKRRTFLGLSLAAAGGAVVATVGKTGDARWATPRSRALAEVSLCADLPDAAEGAEATVRLAVTTPRGVEYVDAGALTVRSGRAEGPIRLAYPFEDRVVGDYLVHAEVRCGRHRAVTAAPVKYAVRRLVWFA
ncbi:MAG: hypothetical protein R3F39_19725 [Myxococcota bacterium]